MEEELAREMVQIMDDCKLDHDEKMALMMFIATSAVTGINEDKIADAFSNVLTDNAINALSDIGKLLQEKMDFMKEVENEHTD